MTLALADLRAAIGATWPAAETMQIGPWTLRNGAGGGKRVSAATADGPVTDEDLTMAEAAMSDMGQTPLFCIWPGDEALDTLLAERGYDIVDPTISWHCPIQMLTDLDVPRVMTFAVWEPLAIMRELWAEGGIGPDRLAIMERCNAPKIGILGRINDKPGGTAFCAVHGSIAIVHALEIRDNARRQGLGKWMMRRAALWAAEEGARTMAVLCTRANAPANGLYTALGMTQGPGYHYRIRRSP